MVPMAWPLLHRKAPLVHHRKFRGRCPKWVNRGRVDQSQTVMPVRFAPKADNSRRSWYVPKAD